MKLQIKRHTVISTMISMTIALFLACTVQPESPGSASESTGAEAVDTEVTVKASVDSTMEAKNNELAIEATVQASTSATSTAQETVDCEAVDPDEYGNIVHWCDDGSYWWIDSVTGYRYEMDADGNGVSDDPAGYPIPELLSKDNVGETSLHDAAESNSPDVATLLIERGADNSAKTSELTTDTGPPELLLKDNDDWDETSLHNAAWKDSLDVATLLIDRGADIEAKDNNGWTPLHGAAVDNSLAVARLLIDHGADIDAKDDNGWTPLHGAAQENSLDVASLLIKLGADIDAKDNNGRTPLQWAAFDNSLDVARLLIDHGANTDVIDLSWMN